jgi:hypothetical protein
MNKSVDDEGDFLQIRTIDICVDAIRVDAPPVVDATNASARVLAGKNRMGQLFRRHQRTETLMTN